MTEELKPCPCDPYACALCPFCRGEFPPTVTRIKEGDVVICISCSAMGPTRRSITEAIEAWNTRLSHSAEKEALIEAEPFLAQLRRVNTERYEAWVGDGQDAGILFDAAELGGEVGELLNVVKKLEREERGWRGSRAAPDDFADECADVLICLDKLARRRGVNLEEATVRKFNATSDKVGLPQKLALRARASLIEEERS